MLHCKVLKVVKWTFTSQKTSQVRKPQGMAFRSQQRWCRRKAGEQEQVFATDGIIERFLKSFDLLWFHRKGRLVGELLVQRCRKNMKKRKFKDANLVRYYIMHLQQNFRSTNWKSTQQPGSQPHRNKDMVHPCKRLEQPWQSSALKCQCPART